MAAEDEYRRGRDLYARGREDLAQQRWARAKSQGFDVEGRLREQGMPTAEDRQRIDGRRRDTSDADRERVMQALREAQPEHIRNPKPLSGVPESVRAPVADNPLSLPETKKVIDEADMSAGGGGDGGGGVSGDNIVTMTGIHMGEVMEIDMVTASAWRAIP